MIVDDEAPAREGLRIRLRREAGVTIVGEFSESTTALDAIAEDAPDLVFLDIEMPVMDGLSMLARKKDFEMPPVVFVTAHDEHAVKAFAVRAFDYLLKPVEQDRLHETLERVREHWDRVRKAELADRVRHVVQATGSESSGSVPTGGARGVARIPVRDQGTIRFVNTDDIDWIDAAGDSVRLHVGRTTHSLRKSMGEILGMLDQSRFLRIHRSSIVNADRVKELQPYFHGEYVVVLKDGVKLKLSRGYRDKLAHLLGLPAEKTTTED
jgi:two-component system LytT family response regulator